MKKIIVFCMGIISVLYILNPGAGIFELIPDNTPFIGNLDEGAASMLFLMCLRYFGIDLTNIFNRDVKKEPEKEVNKKIDQV